MLLTLKNTFLKKFDSKIVRVNSINIVNNILKFIEMVLKSEIDFEISEFYPSRMF